MKFVTSCMQCLKDNGVPSLDFQVIEVTDDGVWHLTCSRNHNTMLILQNHKFEVLFDMGCKALLDGYTREAISDFAVSLERFYEFCVDVFCLHSQVTDDMSKQTWKYVSKQSERQLGAFYYAYLLTYKEAPPVFSNKMVELRNKVVHQGYIPSREEGFAYAKNVFNYIVEIGSRLKRDFLTDITEMNFRRQRIAREKAPGKFVSVMGVSTAIGMHSCDFGKVKFEEAIDYIKGRPF